MLYYNRRKQRIPITGNNQTYDIKTGERTAVMKKTRILVLATVVLLMLTLFGSCAPKGAEKKEEDPWLVGEMLSLKPTSSKGDEVKTLALSNDSGMSGMEAPNQLHNSAQNDMWLGLEEEFITFDAGMPEALGKMYIWNYNAPKKENLGFKKVRIYLSTNGTQWTEFKGAGYPFVFAKADGKAGLAATGLNDGKNSPVNFNGACARYIKIVPEKKEGTWSTDGTKECGLSEIRIFRNKKRPAKGEMIPAVSLDGENSENEISSMNAANNSGMSGTTGKKDTHGNDPAAMWATKANAKARTIIFDLDGTYPIDEMLIWNYNEKGNENIGLRTVKIDYSIDGNSWHTLKNGESNTFEFAKANGSNKLKATNLTDGKSVDFGGAQARYVRFIPMGQNGTWGKDANGNVRYGLSEVRFYAEKGWAVEPARDWTGLFSRENGWLAADGVYSIQMNGGDNPGSLTPESKSLLIFSDTAVGTVDYGEKKVLKHDQFVNHSMAFLEGNRPDPKKVRFITKGKPGQNNIIDANVWLQDLVKLDHKVYMSAFTFKGWSADRMDFVEFDIGKNEFPDVTKFKRTEDVKLRYKKSDQSDVIFGCAVYDNTRKERPNPDQYIYIYGLRTAPFKKSLVVARATKEAYPTPENWEFWNGKDWVAGIENADSDAAEISKANVSSEVNITPVVDGMYKGKYILSYTKDAMSPDIQIAFSDSMTGPFVDMQTIYHATEVQDYTSDAVTGVYLYNAKAHPSLSEKGELLMSYNVNSTDSGAFFSSVYYWHPHFIKLFEIK